MIEVKQVLRFFPIQCVGILGVSPKLTERVIGQLLFPDSPVQSHIPTFPKHNFNKMIFKNANRHSQTCAKRFYLAGEFHHL